jgi:hypothetical protein
MSAHTPGPWSVEMRRGERVTVISAGTNAYGDGSATDVVNAYGMSAADAALICAAPELLTACGLALAALDEGSLLKLRAVLTAAMAKAVTL